MIQTFRKLYKSEAARGQSAVFGSQLVLNLSLFLVLLGASVRLDTGEFARLSLALGWIGVIGGVFNFGLDQAALKLAIERRDGAFITVNFYMKAALFIVTMAGALLGAALGYVTPAIIVASAAGAAFWTSTRVVEQYRRRFARLAALNFALAASRVVIGGLSILSQSWVWISLGVHLIAQAPIHVFTLTRSIRELGPPAGRSHLRPMLKVAPIMFASGALFTALPVITQQAMFSRGELAAASAFGVVQLFVAPLTIMIGTVRIYLLPMALEESRRGSFLGKRELAVLLSFGAALAAGVAILSSLILPAVYGARLPLAPVFAGLYLSAYVAIAVVGILNLRSQRGNLILADLGANGVRFAATWALCTWLTDPLQLVAGVSLVLVIGELGLFVSLVRLDRPKT
ncbi:hypothetical protein [Alsobacter sp. SYSU BS001988]